jgi:hypothetical protein
MIFVADVFVFLFVCVPLLSVTQDGCGGSNRNDYDAKQPFLSLFEFYPILPTSFSSSTTKAINQNDKLEIDLVQIQKIIKCKIAFKDLFDMDMCLSLSLDFQKPSTVLF